MMDRLISEIKASHPSFGLPAKLEDVEKLESEIGFTLPDDLRSFYLEMNGVRLFAKGGDVRYEVLPVEEIRPVGTRIFGETFPGEGPSKNWYAFVDMMDGNYVAIDFEGDGGGVKFLDIFHESFPSECEIVATSFEEFLERALATPMTYWLQSGFAGYGYTPKI